MPPPIEIFTRMSAFMEAPAAMRIETPPLAPDSESAHRFGLDHPFFGSLLFRFGSKAIAAIATMATDGVSLFYNPEFVETLNAANLAGVLAHEVMHPALHHMCGGDRNQAMEYGM